MQINFLIIKCFVFNNKNKKIFKEKMNQFYNSVFQKGDKINLVSSLITNNPELVNMPFEVTMNSQKTIQSPLTFSLLVKYTEIAKFLLEKGADINFKNSPDEECPIHIACRYGFEEIVRILLDNPKVNLSSINKNRETCFKLALQNSHIQIVQHKMI